MFNSVPLDMQMEIQKKVSEYVDCLANNKQLPRFNVKQLQENYTKMLTIRLRYKMPITMARRIAKQTMSSHFEYVVGSIQAKH